MKFVAPTITKDGEDIVFFGRIENGRVHLVDLAGRSLVFANTGAIAQW